MSEETTQGYSKARIKVGPYLVETAHKSSTPPQTLIRDFHFPGQPEVIVSINEDGYLDVFSPNPISKLHLNGMTLTEKQLPDILRNRNFAVIPEEAGEITGIVKTVLKTISQISKGFSYNPPQYLAKILGIDPLTYVQEKDFELGKDFTYHGEAVAMALLNILGYYKVEQQMGIEGELIPIFTRKKLDQDAPRLEALSRKLGTQTDVSSLFRQIREIKTETYNTSTVSDAIEKLLKPDEERGETLKENLRFPIRAVSCVLYDKFGWDGVDEFLKRYFVQDYKLEKAESGTSVDQGVTHLNIGEQKPETKIQDDLEEAHEFVLEYEKIGERFTDKLTERIVQQHLFNVNLYTSCLHFFEDTLILDDKNVLPELAKIEIRNIKKDGGGSKRQYSLAGKEINFEDEGQFYSGKRAIVDTLEELRKKGDLRTLRKRDDSGKQTEENLSISVGKTYEGRKIDFNRIFLIARHGVVTNNAWLNDDELKVMKDLECAINSEFDFEYEPVGDSYEVIIDGQKAGTVDVPPNADFSRISTMTIFDSLNAPMDDDREFQTAQTFMAVYSMLGTSHRLNDNEIGAGPQNGNLKNAKIPDNVQFRKKGGKKYKIWRKPKEAKEFKLLGEENFECDPLGLASAGLYRIGDSGFDAEERANALKLSRIRFYGIDYIENGAVHILRRQNLDEMAQELYASMGEAGKDLNLRFVRVTNNANEEYFNALIERFVNDMKLSPDELKELKEKMRKKGATVTPDDHRRMVLQAQYLSKRSLVDHVLAPIATMVSDGKIVLYEKFVYDLYREVLTESKVPKEVIDFIDKRAMDLSEIEKTDAPEEEELPNLIRSAIIMEEGDFSKNPQYSRIMEILTDMIIPLPKRKEELIKLKERYSTEFMIELARFIDEMPSEGEDVFTDRFFRHFRTGKKNLLARINRIADDEQMIADASKGNYIIDQALRGHELGYDKFKEYILAMARLPKNLKERVLRNMLSLNNNSPESEELYPFVVGEIIKDNSLKLLKNQQEMLNNLQSTQDTLEIKWFDEVDDGVPETKAAPNKAATSKPTGISESIKKDLENTVNEMFLVVDARIKQVQQKYNIKPPKPVNPQEEDAKVDKAFNDFFGIE